MSRLEEGEERRDGGTFRGSWRRRTVFVDRADGFWCGVDWLGRKVFDGDAH